MPCGQLASASSTRVPCKARLSRFLNAYEMSTILYGEIPNTLFALKAKVRYPIAGINQGKGEAVWRRYSVSPKGSTAGSWQLSAPRGNQ